MILGLAVDEVVGKFDCREFAPASDPSWARVAGFERLSVGSVQVEGRIGIFPRAEVVTTAANFFRPLSICVCDEEKIGCRLCRLLFVQLLAFRQPLDYFLATADTRFGDFKGAVSGVVYFLSLRADFQALYEVLVRQQLKAPGRCSSVGRATHS